MRVTMTELRSGGRPIAPDDRKVLRGTLSTIRFQGGDTWYKVLQFQEVNSVPHKFLLYDPRVKDCPAEGSVVCYSGMSHEGDAWVAQEWLINVAPQPGEGQSMGVGWINPARHRGPQA